MNNTVYPVSYALIATLKELPMDQNIPLATIYKVAVEVVKEYEHGTADIEDLGLNSVQQYKNVIEDFILYLKNYLELKEEAYGEASENNRGHR